jgi:TetR/AcrR family transcriptional regulator, transcriptional repressor for nem operon
MARPRQFDEEAALDAATRCFWSRGYEASSIRDLSDCMGIGGASLYNSFDGKRALFGIVLNRYVERGFDDRAAQLEKDHPPREAIEMFFAGIVERSLNDAERKGCMLVNSALEVAPHDQEFRKEIVAVRRCVEAGQGDGSISRKRSAEDLARLLFGTLLGLRVLASSRPAKSLLEGLLRPVLVLLNE